MLRISPVPVNWVVEPTDLPVIRRRCYECSSETYRANGKFRVNANGKLLDVWLLALCTKCGETIKLPIMERVPVKTIRPDLLGRLHHNDPALAAELLLDPVMRRRNHISLDWNDAWRLDTGGSDQPGGEVTDVAVRFAAPIPVRPARLIAEGCGISRSEVDKLISDGKIVSTIQLGGKTSSDFMFTIRR
jgi:hypothetical protein